MPVGICCITARGKEEVQEGVSPGQGEAVSFRGVWKGRLERAVFKLYFLVTFQGDSRVMSFL